MTMRLQLALNVDDLDQAIEYYGKLFGEPVHKREPGYANFVVDSHNLKLVLFEAPGSQRLNHVGFEVFEDAEVNRVAAHLSEQAVLAERQEGEVCCYARQNKAISYDPQGLMWEWYRVLEDSPTFFEKEAAEETACCTTACCT
jgi:catechol 2,3-dioxygenase-like lactoylglutathione lyase family enzyme